MTKKIEGFTVKDGGEIPNITPFPPNDYPQCVTVVLHEHRHERVFTESEVRDMINAMAEACDLAPIHYKVVGEHGIVLDPA